MAKSTGKKVIPVTKRTQNEMAYLNQTFGTPDGKRALKFLHDICGFAETSTVIAPTGEVNANSVIHNAAQRGVYLTVRRHIRKDILQEVEHYQPEATNE
jgi:hypothetical protein